MIMVVFRQRLDHSIFAGGELHGHASFCFFQRIQFAFSIGGRFAFNNIKWAKPRMVLRVVIPAAAVTPTPTPPIVEKLLFLKFSGHSIPHIDHYPTPQPEYYF